MKEQKLQESIDKVKAMLEKAEAEKSPIVSCYQEALAILEKQRK